MDYKHTIEFLDNYGKHLTNYYNSISSVKIIKYEVKILNNKYEIVFTLPDYWKWVENGRKPGKMPPINSIMKWVRKKNIPIKTTLKQTAFVIARSIGKKGIKGKHYLKKSKEQLPDFKTGLIEAIKKDIQVTIKTSLKK